MLHCPLRSPFSASSRLDGGCLKSSIRVAASSCVRRIAARSLICGGRRRDRPVVKKRSVSASAKDWITPGSINAAFTPSQTHCSLPHFLRPNRRPSAAGRQRRGAALLNGPLDGLGGRLLVSPPVFTCGLPSSPGVSADVQQRLLGARRC